MVSLDVDQPAVLLRLFGPHFVLGVAGGGARQRAAPAGHARAQPPADRPSQRHFRSVRGFFRMNEMGVSLLRRLRPVNEIENFREDDRPQRTTDVNGANNKHELDIRRRSAISYCIVLII